MKVFALVVAAGSGSRMTSGRDDKPFIELCGCPLVWYSLEKLEKSPLVDSVTLAVKENYIGHARDLVARYGFKKVSSVIAGGATRTDSVRRGLAAMKADDLDILIIQDGARPFLSEDMIRSSVEAAERYGAAVVGVPCTATIKEVGSDGAINATPDRNRMWEAQTPQVFRYDVIRTAYEKFPKDEATDDSALVERMGHKVMMVEGSRDNIKVTVAADIAVAEAILGRDRGGNAGS